jgi:hypothetical protein
MRFASRSTSGRPANEGGDGRHNAEARIGTVASNPPLSAKQSFSPGPLPGGGSEFGHHHHVNRVLVQMMKDADEAIATR